MQISDVTLEPSPLSQPPAEFSLRLVRELPRLRRYLAARGSKGARLDDLVQETVLRALESAHGFDEGRGLWPWLQTIARRAGGSEGRPSHEESLATEPLASEPISTAVSEDLEALLARLPVPERVVIERYYVGGQSVAEISSALSIAQGTVQSRMWRARRRLAGLAAALATALWFLLRGGRILPEPSPEPLNFQPLSLRTARLAPPTLGSIETAADEPFTWSLEGAVWSDHPLSEKDN